MRNLRPYRAIGWLAVTCVLAAGAPGWPADETPSVAMMPLARPSADLTDDPLPACLPMSLTEALARVVQVVDQGQVQRTLQALKVPRRPLSVVDATRVGNALEVRWLADGVCERKGNVLTITLRLIDARSGAPDPGRRVSVTRKLAREADALLIQEDLVAGLLKVLEVTPDGPQLALIRQVTGATANLGAWTLLMRGRMHFLACTRDGDGKAVPLLEKAASLEPRCALAWAWLAEAMASTSAWEEAHGQDGDPRGKRALECARKAVALAPGLPDAYRAVADAYGTPYAYFGPSEEPAGSAPGTPPKLAAPGPGAGKPKAPPKRAAAHAPAQELKKPPRSAKPPGGSGVKAPGRSGSPPAPARPGSPAPEMAASTGERRMEWNARKAIELNPRDAQAHRYVWHALGQPIEGAGSEVIHKALEIDPRLGVAWRKLGNALYEADRIDEAATAYRKAVAANPNDAFAWYDLAMIFAGKGEMDEAMDACRKADAADPGLTPATLYLGSLLYSLSRLDEASVAYRKAIEQDPKDAEARGGLASVLYTQRKWSEAAEAYGALIELEPNSATGWLGLAGALYMQEKWAEASDA